MAEEIADGIERILHVELIAGENMQQALSGGGVYTAGLAGGPHARYRVQDGWVVVSHTFEVAQGGTAGLLTVLLERRRGS